MVIDSVIRTFFLITKYYYKDIPQFVYSSIPVNGYLGCFRVLAVTNEAAVNIHVQVRIWKMLSFLLQ